MKILLDTVAFLWWVTDDPMLPASARETITEPSNIIFLSAASAWEISIKARLGKIKVSKNLPRWFSEQLRKNGFLGLAISVRHAAAVYKLPQIHGDPFDRMLVAQSRIEKCRILTNDQQIAQYPVRILW